MKKRDEKFTKNGNLFWLARGVFLSFLILFSMEAFACIKGETFHGREAYKSIYKGTVESAEYAIPYFNSDMTSTYIVHLTNVEVILGEGPVDNMVRLGGCSIPMPAIGTTGTFYVEERKRSRFIFPIYEEEGIILKIPKRKKRDADSENRGGLSGAIWEFSNSEWE